MEPSFWTELSINSFRFLFFTFHSLFKSPPSYDLAPPLQGKRQPLNPCPCGLWWLWALCFQNTAFSSHPLPALGRCAQAFFLGSSLGLVAPLSSVSHSLFCASWVISQPLALHLPSGIGFLMPPKYLYLPQVSSPKGQNATPPVPLTLRGVYSTDISDSKSELSTTPLVLTHLHSSSPLGFPRSYSFLFFFSYQLRSGKTWMTTGLEISLLCPGVASHCSFSLLLCYNYLSTCRSSPVTRWLL